jgi:hypothetical protein
MICAGPGAALAFPVMDLPVPVVEFHNSFTGHYFLTADTNEALDIEAGKAGPGWVRTGLVFQAHRAGATYCPGDCGVPVQRFYGPGQNTHVFTAHEAEAAALRRPGSGWIFERTEFRIVLPDAAGGCGPGQVPVLRFYNSRGAIGDANHRYLTRDDERARMKSRGWLEEGVGFCAYGAGEIPILSYALDEPAKPFLVLPSAQCEDESLNTGPCIAVNNLVPPSQLVPPTQVHNVPPEYSERTGFASSMNYVQPDCAGSAAQAAAGAFVQGIYRALGIHVETTGRGASIYSSINPLYQFNTAPIPGVGDFRLFPWGIAYESDAQLSISGTINVKRLRTAPGSHAYGHPTLEFIDQRSGQHLYFTVGTYGTVDLGGEYLAIDPGTGKVIVGTSLRPQTPYGRATGIPVLPMASGFVSDNAWGWGGAFDFRMDRTEFQRVVDAARRLNPGLSGDVRDYFLDNFHFNNEVVGDGEIGLNLSDYKLQVVRR